MIIEWVFLLNMMKLILYYVRVRARRMMTIECRVMALSISLYISHLLSYPLIHSLSLSLILSLSLSLCVSYSLILSLFLYT